MLHIGQSFWIRVDGAFVMVAVGVASVGVEEVASVGIEEASSVGIEEAASVGIEEVVNESGVSWASRAEDVEEEE